MLHWMVHLKGPRRASHAAVAVRHNVYTFGGYCDGETYRHNRGQLHVHVFNTVSLRWAKTSPRATSIGRAERPLGGGGEVPSMRYGHTAALMDDTVYVWGGSTYTREDSKELYAFHVDAHAWFKPRVSGTVPGARRSHSACVVGRAMYIYGGYSQLSGCTNDIYSLDPVAMLWSLVNARGTLPPVSFYHSATNIGSKMFVFGGQGDRFENISVFDTETNVWLSTSPAQLLPEGRGGVHSAFAYNKELYVFTSYPMTTFVDLWKFNPESFSWKKVEPTGKNPSSWMSRMCCCVVGNRIFLFAGYNLEDPESENEDDEDEMSDLYVLDLSPSLKTLCKLEVIQCCLEQSGLPHDIRWELAALATNSHRKHNASVLSAREAGKSPFGLRVCQRVFMAAFVAAGFHYYNMLL